MVMGLSYERALQCAAMLRTWDISLSNSEVLENYFDCRFKSWSPNSLSII